MRPNSIIQVSKPAAMPLDLVAAKRYLKINHSHDDELLNMLIFAVGCRCETYTGLSLIVKDWRAQYSRFSNKFYIPIGPLQDVTAVKVMHNSGSSMLMTSNLYTVVGDCILLNGSVPMGKVNVYFTAGFGESNDDIPADLKMVMLEHLADLYETRSTKSNFTMDGYNDFRFFKI